MKSLYYCRSKSIQRAGFAGKKDAVEPAAGAEGVAQMMQAAAKTDYDECLACQ